jgi:hypothetical protein
MSIRRLVQPGGPDLVISRKDPDHSEPHGHLDLRSLYLISDLLIAYA